MYTSTNNLDIITMMYDESVNSMVSKNDACCRLHSSRSSCNAFRRSVIVFLRKGQELKPNEEAMSFASMWHSKKRSVSFLSLLEAKAEIGLNNSGI